MASLPLSVMEVPVPLAVAWSVIPRQVEIEFVSEYLFWTEEIAYEKYHLDGTLSVSIDMIIIWVATAVLLEGAKRATCDFARSAILTVLERGAKNDDRGRKSFFVPE